MTEERIIGILLGLGMAIVLVALILLIGSTASHGREICLTKKEARHLFPRAHLYWYSGDHCWSNRRGGPPRGIKIDPVPNDPVFPKQKSTKEVVPDETRADNRQPDAHKKEPRQLAGAEDEDHCCWPPLDVDPSGNLVEPPLTFAQRWQEIPSVFVFYRQRYWPH